MAKKIEVKNRDGSVDVYESGLLRGYHTKETDQGTCIVQREFNSLSEMIETGSLTKETTVQCYGKQAETAEEGCPVCESVNPTQRTD